MVAIKANHVSKSFKIFKEKSNTLKDRLIYKGRTHYEMFHALNDISLTIDKGETIGLIGRNGSGKSTLLKLFTKIIYPDSGEIEIEGKISSLLELGAGFHPDFTGRENIFMNAAILGLNKKQIKNRLHEIIAFSELEEYIDNPVRSYSSGMYMRLAFSVAIMVEPDVLLIDEVLAVGDAAFQQKCFEQLIKLKRKGTTIVFVSHDLGAVEKLCDRVFWINKGDIAFEGEAKKAIDMYLLYLNEQENNRLLKEKSEDQSISIQADIDQNEDSLSEDSSESSNSLDEEDRWGDRRVEITDVRFTGSNEEQKLAFMTSEAMKIYITYRANDFIEKPIFGVGIFTLEHVCCYGTNTFIDYYPVKPINKNDTGCIIFEIPSLDLISGSYYLSVAVHDEFGNQFDYHNKKYTIRVSSLNKDVGIVNLRHKWFLK